MRRMISEKFQKWIKGLFQVVQHNDETNTTEVGDNLEVDGNITSNSNIQADVFESSTEVGGVKVMFAEFNPTGKEDNHFHLTNSTVKLDDSNGVSHTIDEITSGGGGTQLYRASSSSVDLIMCSNQDTYNNYSDFIKNFISGSVPSGIIGSGGGCVLPVVAANGEMVFKTIGGVATPTITFPLLIGNITPL